MNNETLPTHYHSKASQKEALDAITRQYETLRGQAHKFILNDESHKLRSGDRYDQLSEIYWGLPHYPHQVREKHYAWFEVCGIDANQVRGLVTARDYIKSLPIVKKPKVEKSEGKRTERSATHRGCCQICGKSHKVDVKSGLLAEHGYTYKNTGYFTGSCAGSGQLPINVSVDFLKSEFDRVEKQWNEFSSADPEGIAYTYFTEKLVSRPLRYVPVEHKVSNAQASRELGAVLANWHPIIANWKPSDLTPIKYDN
jgi:hypothetical protein